MFVLIVASLATVLSCVALGLRVLELLRLKEIPRAERAAMAFGLGIGALSICALLLGLAGIVGSAPAAGLLSLFLLAGLGPLIRLFKTRQEPCSQQPTAKEATDQDTLYGAVLWLGGLLVVFVALIVLYALTAFLPPLDYDDLEYHLGAPAEYLRAGNVHFISWNVYASFPQQVEMTYLHGMWLHGSAIEGAYQGRLLNIFAGVMTVLAAFSVARRWLSVELSLVGALLFYSAPLYGFRAQVSHVEIQQTLFTTLAVAAFLRAYFSESRCDAKWAGLSGVFAGLAFGCKYTAGVLTALPLAVMSVLWTLLRRERVLFVGSFPPACGGTKGGPACGGTKGGTTVAVTTPPQPSPQAGREQGKWSRGAAFKGFFSFGLGFLILSAPWLCRNLAGTGNPVFPLGYSVFGSSEWDTERDAKFAQAHEPLARFRASQATTDGDDVGNRAATVRERSKEDDVPEELPTNRLAVLAREIREGVVGTEQDPPTLPATLLVLMLLAALKLARGTSGSGAPRHGALHGEDTVGGRRHGAAADASGGYRGLGALLFFALFYFAAWALATHVVLRFMVPLLPVLGILSAAGIDTVRTKPTRIALLVIVLATAGVYVWEAGDYYLKAVSCAVDEKSASELFAKTEDTLPLAALDAVDKEWQDLREPHEAFVVFVGDAQAFHCRFDCIAPTVFNKHPLEGIFDGKRTPREIEFQFDSIFRSKRLAVVVHHGELERLSQTYRFVFEGQERPGLPRLWDREVWEKVLQGGRWRRIYSSPHAVIEVFVRG